MKWFKASLMLPVFVTLIAGPAFSANCGDGVGICAGGDTLTASYTLPNDLDCDNDGNALNIGADNVVLNLNGYTIRGNTTSVKEAIYSDGYDGLEIRGPGTIIDTEGIKVYSGDGTVITGLTILNAIDVDSDDGGNDAIYIGQDTGDQPANVEISENIIGILGSTDDITRQAISLVSCATAEISDNYIYGGRIGIDIEPNTTRTVSNFSVLRNTIDTLANTVFYGGGEYHMGISIDGNVGTVSGTNLVNDNFINLNGDLAGGKATGFYNRGLNDSSTITLNRNTCIGVKRGVDVQGGFTGTMLYDVLNLTADATNYGLGINLSNAAINNITFNRSKIIGFLYPVDVNLTTTVGVINFYNNVIDVSKSQFFGLRIQNNTHTINLSNNIFSGTPNSGHVYVQVSGASPTVTANYNCYESAGDYWNWQSPTDINFAVWQVNADTNGINTDPLLNDDWSIKRTSPCRNAGDNSVVDASVHPIWGGIVDIGAVEYEEKGISGGLYVFTGEEAIVPVFGMLGADDEYILGADGEYIEYYH
jgi:hypothetical protein